MSDANCTDGESCCRTASFLRQLRNHTRHSSAPEPLSEMPTPLTDKEHALTHAVMPSLLSAKGVPKGIKKRR